MAKYRITAPDGGTYEITAPDDATQEQVLAYAQANYVGSGAQPKSEHPGAVKSAVVGVVRGAKDVIDTGAQWLASGFDKLAGTNEGERVKQMNDAGKADFQREYGNSTAADIGRLGGNIAATWPVGGLLGAAVRGGGAVVGASKVAEPVAQAIASGGMRAGGVTGTAGLATRAAGGAVSGGAMAGLVDPKSAGTGAAIGAALPGAIRAATAAGSGVVRATRKAFAPSTEAAAQTVLKAAGANTPDQIAALRAALSSPRPSLLGEELTVPQILQTPGLSQLQRTLRNAGDEALLTRHAEQNAQRLDALNRISPVTGTPQQAAQRFGNELEAFAHPANDRARQAVNQAYEAVDPHDVTAFRIPVDQMRGARDQFLGPGTFGTGRRADQAIDAAEGLTTTHGTDPMTGAPAVIDRLSPFREIQNLRSSIGEAAATAQANGANKEFAALSRMINAIDQRLDEVAAGRGGADELFPASVVAQWRRANDMHAARLQRYETGPQRAMWRQGGDGQPVAQGGELAPKFFNASKGQADDVAAFQRLRGQDFPADGLKNYAITDLASQTDQLGNLLPARAGNWLDARSGAIPGLFNEGEQATLSALRQSLDRAALAENLGRATGSNTAQNAQSALNLGLLDNPAVNFVAGRIPIFKNFSAPTLEALRKNAREAKVRELGELLSDPQALNEAISGLLSRPGASGLLSAPERPGGLLGLSVRAAPLLQTSP